MTLKKILKGKLTKKELELAPSSFDIIGSKERSVAVIDIPKELMKKKRSIALALIQKHKNIRSVLLKASKRKGKYRKREYKFIAGSRNTEVIHKENSCRFLLDLRKVYFSQREATERLRIVKKVKRKETVMIFFAGIGPFAIEIAKLAKPESVIGIEANPTAVKYFNKNVKLNKVDINVVKGDVKKKAASFSNTCDRVLMPLPETSIDYITYAVRCLKSKGVCHVYLFSEEEKINEVKKKIRSKTKKKIRFVGVQRVLPYGPRIWKYRIDFKIL